MEIGRRVRLAKPGNLARRDMLRLGAGGLLAAGLWPGCLRAEGDGDAADFHFIEINDTHYVDGNCAKFLGKAVAKMKASAVKADFCLHCGDLSDHGRPEELTGVKDVFAALGIPTYAVVGNHDFGHERKYYDEIFPERVNYHFENRGWQFVGLDTTQGRSIDSTQVQAHTFAWLDAHLPKLDKKRPTVAFTHFPLGPEVRRRPLNADAVLARFREFNLQAVFSGHYHAFTERKLGKATLTTHRCCSLRRGNYDGDKEKGYFLCHAKDGKVSREFVAVKT